MKRYEGFAWQREDGLWLVVDSTMTHTKLSNKCSYTSDIDEATVTHWPPYRLRQLLTPVKVVVTHTVVKREDLV